MSNVVLFDIMAVVVLVILLAHLYSSYNVSGIYNLFLKSLVWAAVYGSVFAIVTLIIWDLHIEMSDVWFYILVCSYFSSYIILGILYAAMNTVLFEMYYVIKKIHKILFVLPFAIDILLLILNPWTGVVFYLSKTGAFHRGIGYSVYVAMPVLYLLFGIFCVLRFSSGFAKAVYQKMEKMYLMIICFSIINICIPKVVSTLPAIVVALLMLVLEISNMTQLTDRRTRLYNRRYLKNNMQIRMKTVESFKLYVIKVDDISVFHHLYDKESEDELIKQLGGFVRKVFRNSLCCQLGDFSFAGIVSDFEKFDEEKVLKQCLERFENVRRLDRIENQLSIKIGIINYPEEVKDEEEIMEAIDCICRSESEERGVHIIRMNDDKFAKYRRGVRIENLISNKLENNEFQVYFQPIYSIKEQKISSAEALLRLHDEEMGFISPDEFIPISERNGSIIEIGKFVFREVCRFISQYEIEKLGIQFVEINLSPAQCMQSKLAGQLIEIMKEYNVSSDKINLEITETVAAHMMQELKANMHCLSSRGIKFSMDDYGTGYSNMSSVINLPFHFVKLDKSIVWSAFENEKAYTVMQSSVQMFKKLNLEVVAEGIEKKEQLNQALKMGCDYIQGYYYSKPLPMYAFLNYMREMHCAVK